VLELFAWGDTGWGDEMARGAAITFALAICAYLLGIAIGIAGASLKLGGGPIGRALAGTYTTVIRGVPELLVIYLFAFGAPGAVMFFAESMFGYDQYIEPPAFLVGTVAVGLISGAYSTEVIRGAMQMIPEGQIEAGRAVGMSERQIFVRIKLPQLWRLALPGLGNVWQLTLKDTALVSVTALAELMRMAEVASGSTRSPFVFYIVAAMAYLAMTTVSQTLFQLSEQRASRHVQLAR
jgi:octopine/nopaline transport system permease protein